ncbi:hypothetical protein ACFYYY_21305 [Streptomyces sp. NPDC001834]
MERDDYARVEELAVAVLGRDAHDSAYAEGGGLSLEEATALAEAHVPDRD